jgi:hypothetical protein
MGLWDDVERRVEDGGDVAGTPLGFRAVVVDIRKPSSPFLQRGRLKC